MREHTYHLKTDFSDALYNKRKLNLVIEKLTIAKKKSKGDDRPVAFQQLLTSRNREELPEHLLLPPHKEG